MARLSAHGREIARYLDPKRGALVAVMADGTRLYRTPFHGWKVLARKKSDVSISEWTACKLAYIAKLPAWCVDNVRSMPSAETLAEWVCHSVCESVTGDTVEPDGHGPDGAPSWLIFFRMI